MLARLSHDGQHRHEPRSRTRSRRAFGILPLIALVALLSGGSGFALLAANAGSTGVTASYQTVSSWGSGYSGQYTLANVGSTATTTWTLSFRLPAGTSISSMWNGFYSDGAGLYTVTPVLWSGQSWDASIKPGASLKIGFVTEASGGKNAGQPTGCLINGASCAGGGAPPAPVSGSATPSPVPTKTVTPKPSPSMTTSAPSSPPASPAPSGSPVTGSPGAPVAGAAGFAPYVDTTLYPAFSLTSVAQATGVKQFNLAFVVADGSGGSAACTPSWGGVYAMGADPTAAQISALRAMGGDVRISFGGEDGSELAQTCTSVSQLEAAYQEVVSTYDVNKIDFDIEGAAQDDSAANSRRDQALADLQAADKGLQISFTLPVLPSGLTSDGLSVLTGAVKAGVQVSAVDVMAMDYGDSPAPDPAGNMGTYAIDAATATDAQVATALSISDASAWSRVAVTPMIGQNDETDEVFTAANAQQLEQFAASKHLAWLSMWSAARDTECPGGADGSAQPTCSGVVQSQYQFMDTFGAY
jgi:hypothetical protein